MMAEMTNGDGRDKVVLGSVRKTCKSVCARLSLNTRSSGCRNIGNQRRRLHLRVIKYEWGPEMMLKRCWVGAGDYWYAW